MKETNHTLKKLLLGVILAFMLIPLAQQHLHFYESDPLKGAIVPKEKPYFSLTGWWSGVYQESYGEWYNENFGLRPEMVRLHNQIAFELYHQAKANGVIIGKQDYLYELNYIRALTGEDFIGFEKIDSLTDKLKAVQDSLDQKNITLIVCLAAGKASFYPEYIPDEFGKPSDTTNYKVMSAMFIEKGIRHIDFNKWFISMKGHTAFPLFPKTGIHWSRYGSTKVADSLIRFIERERKTDMPGLVWKTTAASDSLRSPDDDIGEAMNLMWPIRPLGGMGYPVYHFEDTAGKASLSMMTIADSYFWSLFDCGMSTQSFNKVDFYYYNTEVYHSDGTSSAASVMGGMNAVESNQVVMILSTEANLFKFGWGFIDQAYDRFVLHRLIIPIEDKIRSYQQEIRNSPQWLKDITLKARDKGISVDSMIYLDARYMAEQEAMGK